MTRSVAYFGTYDAAYARNAVLIRGLRESGVTVHEFCAPLPALPAAEMATPAGVARLSAAIAGAHLRLLRQHRRELRVDAVVVGYPGHFAVPFGKLVASVRRAPLVFDPLVSLWDTFAGDRGLVASGSVAASAVRAVDRVAFRLPDLILADTRAHAAYYQAAVGVPRSRLAVVPVGALACRDPAAGAFAHAGPAGGPLTVLQYGKWSPLHGTDTVLEAARLLRDERFHFVLVGEGQLSTELREKCRRLGLTSVEWRGAVPPAELRTLVQAADVCLGVFGTSAKAARVVPNKVYDALACGRPLVTADGAGPREALHDGETALLVPAGDAQALAAALLRLRDDDERRRLGAAALALFERAFTPAAVAARFLTALEATV